ncbi:hypothetical protein SAMN04490243_0907 [Robiginitalea myxolifaciens]|uniref:Copper chaperone NosL n=1 Tax=Robiginitalea myxolifaciens TaxID=400055 RepID=A0A1I6FYD0_9FLAO|nr:hypothetical protein [Robiginitalea myxolifaciens]SFR34911.1 hypothetical protein SAMN04490243_0907 [Robiginitalea myxolifaciens]
MKKAGYLMMLGSTLLLGLYFLPLWNIMLGAPQYPEPLGMNIHIDGIRGVNEFDIQNIDGLNHYIGMRTLPKDEDMWEFSVFPIIVGFMSILGILFGLLGAYGKLTFHWFFIWFVLMSVLGVLGIYDFNAWMIDYGTNLDPKAIMKLTNPDGTPINYKPPLFGHVKMLNFDVTSFPAKGAWLMFLGMSLNLIAGFLGYRSASKSPVTTQLNLAK